MADDSKVGRLAELLLEKHGDDALAVAADRAAWRLAVQEYRWAALWALVAGTIRAARPEAKPGTSIWRVPVPLKELMDDPLMDAVVQDDDGRRREVHETLLDAKRKRESD
jgi:hypothetical protein